MAEHDVAHGAGILDGIRIVDLSDGIAGPVATLLLAEAGADVVAVEPPGGAANRGVAGFHTWMRSKRSVVLDLDDSDDRAALDRLLAAADVVVHNHGPTRARELGLDDDALAARFPQLIVSSVLAWPVNHADADLPVDELLTMARLGVLDEQQGYHEGPLFLRCPIASWCASHLAAIGIVARLISRERTGHAGPAHTSLAQGALVPMAMHWRRVEHPSQSLAVGMPKGMTGATLFETGDGVWIHLMGDPTKSPLFAEAMAVVRPDGPRENPDQLFQHADGWAEALLLHPSAEWLESFWANDVPVQPAAPLGAIFADEQARLNGYVVEVDHPELGTIAMAGSPVTVTPPTRVQVVRTRARRAHRRGAGRVGAARATVVVGERHRRTREHPLEGVQVVDAGAFLAGPLGPMLLSDLGADVVKVEPPGGEGMRWVEWSFFGCQRGKRGVALDLKSPDARVALDALLARADILHHNLRMPAARRLGLDEATVRAVNPDIVYCHASSYGPHGPRADWPGYDQLFQSSCGWEVAGAGEGNDPMWHRLGFMDHLCAMGSLDLHAARAVPPRPHRRDAVRRRLAARRWRHDRQRDVPRRRRRDRARSRCSTTSSSAPRPGTASCEVADGWVAVAATTDAQRDALAALGGVDALVARTVADSLAALADAGVPSDQVRLDQGEPFFSSADNDAAGLIARYEHVDYGHVEQPGAFWIFGDLDVKLDRAPPGLGEHTVEVLTEVGLDPATIDALVASGAAHAWKATTPA